MKEWLDKGDLVSRLAQARREARDTGPRDSNDHLEAAMFIAMEHALKAATYLAAVHVLGGPEPAPEALPAAPDVVTDESPPLDHEPEQDQEPSDVESAGPAAASSG